MNFCNQCGIRTQNHSKFCSNCGANFNIQNHAKEYINPSDRLTIKDVEIVQPQLASRSRRLCAQMLDIFIILVMLTPFFYFLYRFSSPPSSSPFSHDLKPLLYASFILAVVIYNIFQWVLLSIQGQTVGKYLMKARIVRVDNDDNPGFLKAVVLRLYIPGLLSAIPLLGYVFSLINLLFIFRSDRRCLHDLIAGTKVIKI